MARDERSTVPATVIDRLFAYGTLQVGQGAHGVVAPFVRATLPATVRGSMYAFPASHPGIVPDGGGVIYGTLFQLAELPAALPLLDAYEGDDFIRILTEAMTDGGPAWAWAYVLVSPELARLGTPIPHGNWIRYLQEQSAGTAEPDRPEPDRPEPDRPEPDRASDPGARDDHGPG